MLPARSISFACGGTSDTSPAGRTACRRVGHTVSPVTSASSVAWAALAWRAQAVALRCFRCMSQRGVQAHAVWALVLGAARQRAWRTWLAQQVHIKLLLAHTHDHPGVIDVVVCRQGGAVAACGSA